MKTTDKHFTFFVNSVNYYCAKLRVAGWDIRFRHIPVTNGFTETAVDVAARIAEFRLTTDWLDEIEDLNDKSLDGCARHEVGHFFLWRVFDLAQKRYVTKLELDTLDEEMAIRMAELLNE